MAYELQFMLQKLRMATIKSPQVNACETSPPVIRMIAPEITIAIAY